MIYTEMTRQAMRLCYQAHAGQLDKSGVPYVFHPIHLAEQMPDETTTITALLHDVVEDTHYSLPDLAGMGFSQQVLDALKLLTHDDDTPYLEYVARLKNNPVARAVKLADLQHNSDLSRLPEPDPKAYARAEKYRKAIALLTGVAEL